MCEMSVKLLFLSLVIFSTSLFNVTYGITTIHHDKPIEARLSTMAQKMIKDETLKSVGFNVTLPLTERHKRLLPYMTFYLGHNFNKPRANNLNKPNYVSIGGNTDANEQYYKYQTINTQKELEDSKVKFTPFLESNALPGPFLPMVRNNHHLQQQQQIKNINTNVDKLPNYSAIYDKLSQIKLQQQQQQQQDNLRYKTIEYVAPQSQNEQQSYKPNYSTIGGNPFKLQQNSKTIVQSYTPTNIDVPQYDYQDIQPPPVQMKNYAQHQLKTYVQEEYPVQQTRDEYAGEHKQYNRGELRRPIFVYRPKPQQKEIAYVQQVNNNNRPHFVYLQNVPHQQHPVYVDTKPNRPIFFKKQPILLETKNHNQHQQTHPILIDTNHQQRQPYPIYVEEKYNPEQLHQVIEQTKNEPAHQQAQVFIEPIYVDNKKQQNQDHHPILLETKPIYVKENEQLQAYTKEAPQSIYHHKDIRPLIFTKETNAQIYSKERHPEETNPQVYLKEANTQEYVKQANPQFYVNEPNSQAYVKEQLLNDEVNNYREQQNYNEQSFQPINVQDEQLQSPNEEPIKYETIQNQNTITTEDPNNLGLILKHLQETNALPQTLTPENIDNSIKTLVRILSALKNQPKFTRPIVVQDENSRDYGEEDESDNEAGVSLGGDFDNIHHFPQDTPEGGTPGKPGVDYPALSSIPQTSFNCKTQRYKGFFGDPDTNCQVWHYCDLNGGQASFLCPNGTIFSQVALTCDWWYNVKCATTAQLYVLNERLYKYILPLAPKFPEDYSGPLVDRYLALKFREMEAKMKKERKQKQKESSSEETEEDEDDDKEESKTDDADDLKTANEKTTTEKSNYDDTTSPLLTST